MIVFFDTCIHVDILRGALSWEEAQARANRGPVRLSPVVAHELIRGARGKMLRAVDRLVGGLAPIEPPSWRSAWMEAGRLVRAAFTDHEEVGSARLQNDALLTLTARHTGALFVTRDAHFAALRKRLPFALLMLGDP